MSTRSLAATAKNGKCSALLGVPVIVGSEADQAQTLAWKCNCAALVGSSAYGHPEDGARFVDPSVPPWSRMRGDMVAISSKSLLRNLCGLQRNSFLRHDGATACHRADSLLLKWPLARNALRSGSGDMEHRRT